MNHYFGEKENGYQGYGNGAGDMPNNGQWHQYAPEAYAQDAAATAPAGAPLERTDAPVPEKINVSPRKPYLHFPEHSFTPRVGEWCEPSYCQPYEPTSGMYTPGICSDPNRPHRFSPEPERKKREPSGLFGKIVRTACLVLVCAILSGAAAYGVMEYRFRRGDFTVVYENQVVLGGSPNSQSGSSLSASVSTSGLNLSPEDIYDMACTQVVSVTTRNESTGSTGIIPSTQDAVKGSGFIISSDGYILTNYHVIQIAQFYNLPLIVSLNNGMEYEAEIIGYETHNDVALIKIDAIGLNPAIIANSDSIRVGQTVYAVGNPLGELIYTMTDGIVSHKSREVVIEGKKISSFQFSAAVNSGNSGGPVYNTHGEVIGIVTAKPGSNSVEGIGFAIPINDAILIASELIEYGYITGRPLLGITAETVTRAHAEYWEWVVGIRVNSVSEGSAAENAGMMVGDIITALGDTELDSRDKLIFELRKYRAGETSGITVWREGETIELTITFDEDLSAGQVRPS